MMMCVCVSVKWIGVDFEYFSRASSVFVLGKEREKCVKDVCEDCDIYFLSQMI